MNKKLKISEPLADLILGIADSVSGTIYHYTSAEGLKGIIESSEIWLTNVEFVNDRTECKALQEEKELFKKTDFNNSFVRENWKSFVHKPSNAYNTYIASFSRGKEESLEQWRAYGNFRIGFKANKLIKAYFNLFQCVYNKSAIKKWLLKKEKLKEWDDENLTEPMKRMTAGHLISNAAKKYKNAYFINEKEVRLIAHSNHTWDPYPNSPTLYENQPPIHYRGHPVYKVPVPYVKFIIGDSKSPETKNNETEMGMKKRKLDEENSMTRGLLPIGEILIGPMLHQNEAKIACEILLKDKGYKETQVNVSEIPYRGF